MPQHGTNDADPQIGARGDRRQRLAAALHTHDRRAAPGALCIHLLGDFDVELLAQLGQEPTLW
ncbi:hypothetical protein AU183_02160 [Mycolicibacterium novocastrense]|nr:hypothetical protein AU183_02160 [Mycolicibacterium novocastrense]